MWNQLVVVRILNMVHISRAIDSKSSMGRSDVICAVLMRAFSYERGLAKEELADEFKKTSSKGSDIILVLFEGNVCSNRWYHDAPNPSISNPPMQQTPNPTQAPYCRLFVRLNTGTILLLAPLSALLLVGRKLSLVCTRSISYGLS